jgi:hypothetical protein
MGGVRHKSTAAKDVDESTPMTASGGLDLDDDPLARTGSFMASRRKLRAPVVNKVSCGRVIVVWLCGRHGLDTRACPH